MLYFVYAPTNNPVDSTLFCVLALASCMPPGLTVRLLASPCEGGLYILPSEHPPTVGSNDARKPLQQSSNAPKPTQLADDAPKPMELRNLRWTAIASLYCLLFQSAISPCLR